MNLIIKKYKAITQESRLRIIYLLLKAQMPLCICEMMDVLQKEQYQVSRCLGSLKKADLISETREGRLLLYTINSSDPVNKCIFDSIILGELECDFSNDLQRLKKRLALREDGKVVVTYKN